MQPTEARDIGDAPDDRPVPALTHQKWYGFEHEFGIASDEDVPGPGRRGGATGRAGPGGRPRTADADLAGGGAAADHERPPVEVGGPLTRPAPPRHPSW